MFNPRCVGFMQGRLSRIQRGRIQSFPWGYWDREFEDARKIDLDLVEWTIDQFKFNQNPLIENPELVARIAIEKKMRVESVTCDSFMEMPFWQAGVDFSIEQLRRIITGMRKIGAKILVVPLVDNSSLAKFHDVDQCVSFFSLLLNHLVESGIKIAFEVDTNPLDTKRFCEKFDSLHFGINYDIGNSASFGFNPKDEFKEYGNRIINVHVKDRKLHGNTVPLGEGNANLELVFGLLAEYNYEGNLILQTARSENGNHSEALDSYSRMTKKLVSSAYIEKGG